MIPIRFKPFVISNPTLSGARKVPFLYGWSRNPRVRDVGLPDLGLIPLEHDSLKLPDGQKTK